MQIETGMINVDTRRIASGIGRRPKEEVDEGTDGSADWREHLRGRPILRIAVTALGIDGVTFTRDNLKEVDIVFGPVTDRAVAEHAEQWAGEPVETGSQALAFAEIMREHTLTSTAA